MIKLDPFTTAGGSHIPKLIIRILARYRAISLISAKIQDLFEVPSDSGKIASPVSVMDGVTAVSEIRLSHSHRLNGNLSFGFYASPPRLYLIVFFRLTPR